MKYLIDSNVILDVLTNRDPFYDSSRKVFELALKQKIEAYIASSSLPALYYLLHKYYHSSDICKQTILKLFEFFNVVDVDGNDCAKAIASIIPDYEDAIIHETAIRHSMDYIVTRDKKHFKDSIVHIIDPSEL